MKHYLPLGILICSVVALAILVRSVNPPKAASVSLDRSTLIWVSIGEPRIGLYGYTSPDSSVEASNTNIFAQTTSDRKGYFEFNTVFVMPWTKEICLRSFDHEKRSTNPVCIPIPLSIQKTSVGPVILPPSISIAKGTFLPEETVEAKGESIPNTEITVSLFRGEPTLLQRIITFLTPSFISKAYASVLPVYTVKTDRNGRYSFNLPSVTSNSFRLFTQSVYDKSPSPKSNTLTFKILTIFEYLWEKMKLLLLTLYNLIRNLPLLETIIIAQVLLLVFLLRKRTGKQILVIQRDIKVYGEGREIVT